jgi:hypothetical protein
MHLARRHALLLRQESFLGKLMLMSAAKPETQLPVGAHASTGAVTKQQPPPSEADQARPAPAGAQSNTRRRRITFNLNTYKLYSYGDYVATIRKYGTTDSYSTVPVHDASNIACASADLLLSGRTRTPIS